MEFILKINTNIEQSIYSTKGDGNNPQFEKKKKNNLNS